MTRWGAVLALCTACASTAEAPSRVRVPASAYAESTQAAPNARAKQDKDNTFECVTEYETGSRIPVRNCRSLRQIENERRESQDWMNRNIQLGQPQNVRAPGGG